MNRPSSWQGDRAIAGISTDTRSLKKNQVFFALSGNRFDGHRFVDIAFERGALFCVVQEEFLSAGNTEARPLMVVDNTLTALQQLAAIHRQKFNIPLLALTGSNGKTSTKEMVAHILGGKYRVLKTEGNLNNHIGCPLTLLNLNEHHQAAVIELGSNHPGEIGLLADISQPNMALITNIGRVHMAYFKSLQEVAEEKLSLFERVKKEGTIYQNLDDPMVSAYRLQSGVKRVTYALNRDADLRGKIRHVNVFGQALLEINGYRIELQVPGIHMAQNAVAASAVAFSMGFTLPEIAEALHDFRASRQRMEISERDGLRIINDAYNANPVSMKAAFTTISNMKPAGRIFLVLGDMLELGEKSAQWHGQVLREALDMNPEAIVLLGDQMRRAAEQESSPKIIPCRSHQEAASRLKEMLKQGDLLLLKGSRGIAVEKILDYL